MRVWALGAMRDDDDEPIKPGGVNPDSRLLYSQN